MNKPARGSLLGIEHLEEKEILGLLRLARRMNPLKVRPLLRNKRIVLLFYEASTRTRSSFEIAAKLLGAITTLVQSSGSSIEKGESLLDTGATLRAVGADAIVLRHPVRERPTCWQSTSTFRSETPATACTSTPLRPCSTPSRS